MARKKKGPNKHKARNEAANETRRNRQLRATASKHKRGKHKGKTCKSVGCK